MASVVSVSLHIQVCTIKKVLLVLVRVNYVVFSNVFGIQDSKDFYSRYHTFESRHNGIFRTNCTGIAFYVNSYGLNNDIFIVCDANMFDPHLTLLCNQKENYNEARIEASFLPSISVDSVQLQLELIQVYHFVDIENELLNKSSNFKIGYVSSHNKMGNASNDRNNSSTRITSSVENSNYIKPKPKCGYIALLRVINDSCTNGKTNEIIDRIASNILTLDQLITESQSKYECSIGSIVYGIGNPFHTMCNDVLSNSIIHGIVSTIIPIDNKYSYKNKNENKNQNKNKDNWIWLSDMKCLPGFEGGIVIEHLDTDSNGNEINNFIGMLTIPLLISNSKNDINASNLSIIIPKHIITNWVVNVISNLTPNEQNKHYGSPGRSLISCKDIGTSIQTTKNININNDRVTRNNTVGFSDGSSCHTGGNTGGTFGRANNGIRFNRTSNGQKNAVNDMQHSVVAIVVGHSSATGIILHTVKQSGQSRKKKRRQVGKRNTTSEKYNTNTNTVYILTNAHVLRPYMQSNKKEEKDETNKQETRESMRQNTNVRNVNTENEQLLKSNTVCKIGLASLSKKNKTGRHLDDREWIYYTHKHNRNKTNPIEILYVATDDEPWDIALVKLTVEKGEIWNKINIKPICDTKYGIPSKHSMIDTFIKLNQQFGDSNRVFIMGYGLIHPNLRYHSLVTGGILSKIVFFDNKINSENKNSIKKVQQRRREPAMLRVSCSVYPGHSGGILFDSFGNWLGMVTGNVIFDTNVDNINDTLEKDIIFGKKNDKKNDNQVVFLKKRQEKIKDLDSNDINGNAKLSTVHPSINLIIPYNIIHDLYCVIVGDGLQNEKRDEMIIKCCQNMNKKNEEITRMWSLIDREKFNDSKFFDEKMASIVQRIPPQLLEKTLHSKL